ncbi:MAG: yecE 1 [Pseudomonas sp.]|nr:yecE 1 [Pseudomonas sp.]
MSADRLPYYIGCPSWSENAWRDSLYPENARSTDFLGLYAQVFNAVEGNTTFYARPSPTIVQRWADSLPEDFRFSAKFHRDISHGGDLRQQLQAADDFVQLLAPLGQRLAPLWLQLPASFGSLRLAELATFIDTLERPLAVEVRNSAFFAKGDEERMLNRLLLDRGVERICLDPRALFSCVSTDPAVLHAQSKKPKVPPRPAALTQFPQVRFIGHPLLEANDPFLLPWVEKVASWIEEGRTPSVFLHTPDNIQAPDLARRFHQQLMARLPGMPELTVLERAPVAQQLGLL